MVTSPPPVEDVQVSCYRILNSLYFLGTNKSIYVERYSAPNSTSLFASFRADQRPTTKSMLFELFDKMIVDQKQ